MAMAMATAMAMAMDRAMDIGRATVMDCHGPLPQTRDAAQRVGSANLNLKKSLKNGCGSRVVEMIYLGDNLK